MLGLLLRRLLAVLALTLFVGVGASTWMPEPQETSVCQRRRTARTHRTRRRPARPRITAAQRRQIRRWHVRADRHVLEAWMQQAPQPLVLRPIVRFPSVSLIPSEDGTFDAQTVTLAEQAFAYRDDGTTHPIHPRLLELVYRALRHFHAPYVHIVSGYRSGRPTSRHAQGRALDFVLPGVTDRRLASYLRPQGFVGVGIYPTSGFVHLDVRGRSYFWSDASGPSQSNRERQIMRTLGPRFDRIARALGVTPTPNVSTEPELDEETEETIHIDESETMELTDAGVWLDASGIADGG